MGAFGRRYSEEGYEGLPGSIDTGSTPFSSSHAVNRLETSSAPLSLRVLRLLAQQSPSETAAFLHLLGRFLGKASPSSFHSRSIHRAMKSVD